MRRFTFLKMKRPSCFSFSQAKHHYIRMPLQPYKFQPGQF
jgi:hypothetical protein